MSDGLAAPWKFGGDNFGPGLAGNLSDHISPLEHLVVSNQIGRKRLDNSQVDLSNLPPFELP